MRQASITTTNKRLRHETLKKKKRHKFKSLGSFRDQTTWSRKSQDNPPSMALRTMLETGVPANAKDKQTPEPGLSPARGDGESCRLSRLAPLWMDIWRKSRELCPQLPQGKRDLEFVLFCFVLFSSANSPLSHKKYIYQTKTPACKNKDPDGTDVSSAYWSYQARIETPSTFSGIEREGPKPMQNLTILHLT